MNNAGIGGVVLDPDSLASSNFGKVRGNMYGSISICFGITNLMVHLIVKLMRLRYASIMIELTRGMDRIARSSSHSQYLIAGDVFQHLSLRRKYLHYISAKYFEG